MPASFSIVFLFLLPGGRPLGLLQHIRAFESGLRLVWHTTRLVSMCAAVSDVLSDIVHKHYSSDASFAALVYGIRDVKTQRMPAKRLH